MSASLSPSMMNSIAKSNKRLKVGRPGNDNDPERALQATMKRIRKLDRQQAEKERREQEERDRYIIPEYLSQEEQYIQLTT